MQAMSSRTPARLLGQFTTEKHTLRNFLVVNERVAEICLRTLQRSLKNLGTVLHETGRCV